MRKRTHVIYEARDLWTLIYLLIKIAPLVFFCHRTPDCCCLKLIELITRALIDIRYTRVSITACWHCIYGCGMRASRTDDPHPRHVYSRVGSARSTDLNRFSALDTIIIIIIVLAYQAFLTFPFKENKFICNILLLRTCQNGYACFAVLRRNHTIENLNNSQCFARAMVFILSIVFHQRHPKTFN